MITSMEELKQVAMACKSADEFLSRVRHYPITSGMKDSEIRDFFRMVDRKRQEVLAWDKYKNVISPLLKERADCKGLWYECWVDLQDAWDDLWFSTLHLMSDKDIVEWCASFLNEQERFYASSDYIDSLNKGLEKAFNL